MKILADNMLCLKIFEDENCLIARNLYANYVQPCYLLKIHYFQKCACGGAKKTQNAKNFSSLTLIFEFSIKFTTIWYIVYLVTKLVSIFQKEESSAWINKCHLVPPCEVSECASLPAVLHRDM